MKARRNQLDGADLADHSNVTTGLRHDCARVGPTICRSAAGANRSPKRTTAASRCGRSPRRRGISPPSSGPRWRLSAATACSAASVVFVPVEDPQRFGGPGADEADLFIKVDRPPVGEQHLLMESTI